MEYRLPFSACPFEHPEVVSAHSIFSGGNAVPNKTKKTSKSSEKFSVESIDANPWFDLETYMILSQTKRVEASTVELVETLWDKWRGHLNAKRISVGAVSYLLVWLGEDVEKEVNQAWDESPSRSFTMNSLAQAILMATVREFIPEVVGSSCAPVPKPTAGLKAALEEIGLPWKESSTLARQFAMLTYYPFKGSCDICHLKDECPSRAIRAES